jgi:hypothetical protein
MAYDSGARKRAAKAKKIGTDAVTQAVGAIKNVQQVNLQGGLSLCSSTRLSHYSTRTIVTAGTWDIYRMRFRNRLPEPIVALVFVWSNHTVASGSYEGATANSITIAGAVQAYGANTDDETQPRLPVTFGGQLTTTVAPKTTVFSDPVPIYLPVGAEGWLRHAVSTPVANGVYPTSGCTLGGTALFGTNNGEGASLAQASTAKLYEGGGTIGVGPLLLVGGPEAIYGVTASGKIYNSLHIVGDSIAKGYTDPGDNDGSFAAFNRGGPFQRTLSALGKPYAISALSGDSGFVTSAPYTNPYSRVCRDNIGRYASHVLSNYGRNDINVRYQAGDSAAVIFATLQAGAQSLVQQVCGRGRHLAICTVLPTPGSNDGYTTAAGQILTGSGRADEAARILWNNWLRDGSASGFLAQAAGWLSALGVTGIKVRVIDICAPIETDLTGALTNNGGAFKVPAVTTIYESGTATAGTTTSLTDSSKAWTPNAYRGRVVWIYNGTGRYSTAVIQYNTATVLTMITPFSGSATPDSTSQYRIVDAPTADATHPAPWGNALIAAGIQGQITEFLA